MIAERSEIKNVYHQRRREAKQIVRGIFKEEKIKAIEDNKKRTT